MVPSRIYDLLDKYYEGTNSSEELSELVKFFDENEDIPVDLLPDKVMILGIIGVRKNNEPEIDQKLEQLQISKQNGITLNWFKWAIAASILVVMSVVGVNELLTTAPEAQPIYGYYNGKPITNKLVAAQRFNSTLDKISPSFQKMHNEVKKVEEMSKYNDVINKIKP
ncbi:hypothetical protein OAT16_01940 [Prolixibacteraceae bacterium]|nr:hypothetical protein [Prolixibacteraceae bacterium]